jgi:hypothetical protein
MKETQASGKRLLIFSSKQTNSKKRLKSSGSEKTWTQLWRFAKTWKKLNTLLRLNYAQNISKMLDITLSLSRPTFALGI